MLKKLLFTALLIFSIPALALDPSSNVILQVSGTTTTINSTGSGQTVVFPTVATNGDTAGCYATGTGICTVQFPGQYVLISTLLSGSVAWSSGNQIILQYSKNGGSAIEFGRTVLSAGITQTVGVTGGTSVQMNAGDTIKIVGFSTVSNALSSGSWTMFRVPGPNTLTPTAGVSLKYQDSAAASYNDGNTAAFATRVWDTTNGAYASNVFTSPLAGKYDVFGCVQTGSFTPSAGNKYGLDAAVNGSTRTQRLAAVTANAAVAQVITLCGGTSFNFIAGDTLKLIIASSSGSITAAADATVNFISINRTGN